MRYRAEIDGLRALAVVPVILFHTGFQLFGGGFVGVDVFFVISGYLITTIILSELDEGTFSIIKFYERRVRRILPALFVVAFACLPFAWFWLFPRDMESFSRSLAAMSVFASNVFFWQTSDYFDAATEVKPLIHTWSLAVEEQYYVVFPLFLFLAWRLGRRWIVYLVFLVAFTSLGLAQYCAIRYPPFTFYLLPTRTWELLLGVLIAFYTEHNLKKHSYWAAELGSVLGLGLIAYAAIAYDEQTPFPSIYALTPTVGAALIIVFATHNTFVGKLLSRKVLVLTGLISYSAYLWHQPLFAFAEHRSLTRPGPALIAALTVAAVLLAYLTWRFVERPFRNRHRYTRKQVFTLGFMFTVLFVTLGMLGDLSAGSFYRKEFEARAHALEDRIRFNFGLYSACEGDFINSEKCRTSDNPEVLVWGDSYAMHLMDGFLSSNPEIKVMQATLAVCGPFFDVAPILLPNYGKAWAKKCLESNDKVLDILKNTTSIKYVVLSSPFWRYVEDSSRVLRRDGEIVSGGQKEAYDYFERTLRKIDDLGLVPVIFSPTPESRYDMGRCLLKADFFSESAEVCDFDLGVAKEHQKAISEFLIRVSRGHKVVWLYDGVCPDGRCRAVDDGVVIYRDGAHLSREGSALIGKRMNFYKLATDGS